jgi:5-(carboxyamino)imidazole ribonucleotide mutase
MLKVLIVLGSASDLTITSDGLAELKNLGIGFSLRIASAHRSPEFLHEIVAVFENQGGALFICVAGKSAHLAGVVASLTLKPVLAVPVYTPETAGFDALLSMSQMPKGIPVATMGFGKAGFINACLLSAQILAIGDTDSSTKLRFMRTKMIAGIKRDDQEHRVDFDA